MQKWVSHELLTLWVISKIDWASGESQHHKDVQKHLDFHIFWRFVYSPKYLYHFFDVVAHGVTDICTTLDEIVEEFLNQIFVFQLDELLVMRVDEGRMNNISLGGQNMNSLTLFKERPFLNNVQQALDHFVTV